jgi:hypothetical protein
VKLLLDEMHTPAIARALSGRGFDAIAVADTRSLRGLSDSDLLEYSAGTGRAVVTENVGDYSVLVMQWTATGIPHAGVVFTHPRRFHRASLAYPGTLIAALGTFLDDPPITGQSWIWWL